jgi:hypothetical protein
MTTPTAPAVWALRDFTKNVQPPVLINAMLPERLPAGSTAHASVVEVEVPVRAIGAEPVSGVVEAPTADV